MENKLKAAGWFFNGGCSCSPKKYKYKHTQHPDILIKIIRSYNKYEIYRYNNLIASGEVSTFEAAMSNNGLTI